METKRRGGRPALIPGEASVSLKIRVPESVSKGLQTLSVETGETQGAIVRRAVNVEIEKLRASRAPKRKAKK